MRGVLGDTPGMDGKLSEETLRRLVERYALPESIHVTRPAMPRLEDYAKSLESIWASRWLTNAGDFHQDFERRLAEYLGVEHISLFCNGTIALLVALHALRINSGEVITTPFTFPATVHVLYWNGIRPVFCDIDENTYNLDPARIEELISPDTKAILPVHVYGTPCDVDGIAAVAERHGLQVIYDAAHAFGLRCHDRPVLEYGDVSMLSFHATKLFSTIEGGALVSRSAAQKKRIDFLKNFGIADEETVIGPGINGKMNEFQAAFGLLELDLVDQEIAGRRAVAEAYRRGLADIPGLRCLEDAPHVERTYPHFPVRVDAAAFGMSRDDLHRALRQFNVVARKYFHPLCSHYSCYASLPSANPDHLPAAERVAAEILCLPIYGDLAPQHAETIARIVAELHAAAT